MDKNYILINESADEDADYLFFLFKKLYAWIYFSRSNLVDFLYVARVVSPNFSNDQDFHHFKSLNRMDNERNINFECPTSAYARLPPI